MKKAVEIASSMVLMGRGWKVLCNFAKQRYYKKVEYRRMK